MGGSILLTGATGFLGMDLLARLIDRGEQITVMIREGEHASAQERLEETLELLYDERPPAAELVRVVRGDLLEPGLGLAPGDRAELVGSVDRVVHCAASISFGLTLERAREINVEGLERVIELTREIAATGRLRRLLHVSTAYVSGGHIGSFCEHDLDLGQQFRNTYERSKYEGELLLSAATDLPLVIARPSIVVGDRSSGWTPTFNVIYWPMRAFERGLLDEVPARADSIIDFVPVDYVTDGLLALLDDARATGAYNLVAGERALGAAEMIELHSSLTGCPPARLVQSTEGLPQGAETLAPYFDVRATFDDTRACSLLSEAGVVKPDPRDYLGRLIAYAHRTGWGKRPISRQAAIRDSPALPALSG